MANQDTCPINILLSAFAPSTMDDMDFDRLDDELKGAKNFAGKTSKKSTVSSGVKGKTSVKTKSKAKPAASQLPKSKPSASQKPKDKDPKKPMKTILKQKSKAKKNEQKTSKECEQEEMAHQLFHDLEALANQAEPLAKTPRRRLGKVSYNLLHQVVCVCVFSLGGKFL